MKKIVKYYRDILGIDLKDLQHPISEKINSINSSTEIEKRIKKHHLKILGISLMEIKDYDEKIYDFYLKRIVRNKDISVNGHIFEINQCAHLIRVSEENSLDFHFGDASKNEPDFIINNFGFEITSSRFSEDSNKSNPGKKILRKFREKNSKAYANTDCALIMDVNQISYHTLKKNVPVSPTFQEVREKVRNESNFGLVLFLMEWIEKTDKTFFFKGTAYNEFNKDCSSELKQMLKQKFMPKQNTFEGQIIISPN